MSAFNLTWNLLKEEEASKRDILQEALEAARNQPPPKPLKIERLPPPLDDQGDEYQYYDQGQPYGEEMSTHTEMMDRHGTTEGYDRNPFQMSLAELKANKVEDDKAHN